MRDRATRDERGAIAIIVAIVSVVLLVVAGLAVDIADTWAVRGKLQVQVDDAATFAASALPVDSSLVSPSDLDQVTVAKRVAYSLLCVDHVRYQQYHQAAGATSPSAPFDCSAVTDPTSSDADFTAYATSLLTDGLVSFPALDRVKVTSPTADVAWAFGPIAGSASHSEQVKSATAKVYSPGSGVPVGLSLQCLASGAGTAPEGLGDVVSDAVPLNYIAAGPLGPDSTDPHVLDATLPQAAFDGLGPDATGNAHHDLGTWTVSSLTPGTIVKGTSLATVLPTITSPGSYTYTKPVTYLGVTYDQTHTVTTAITNVVWHFYLDTEKTTSSADLLGLTLPAVPVPSDVVNTAGVWLVQAQITADVIDTPTVLQLGPITIGALNAASSTVSAWTDPLVDNGSAADRLTVKDSLSSLADLTACANLTDNPRQVAQNGGQAPVGTIGNLRLNISNGIDHPLQAASGLLNTSPPSSAVACLTQADLGCTTGGVLDALNNGLLNCGDNSPPGTVYDGPNVRSSPADCVKIATDGERKYEFTEGFLGDPTSGYSGNPTQIGGSPTGRLSCGYTGLTNDNCPHGSFSIAGFNGTYNDDTFADFLNCPAGNCSPLASQLFFSLSSYLTDDLPVVTPPQGYLKDSIYSSPRFMWAAVVSQPTSLDRGTNLVTVGCTTCPIITFRPIFITQDEPPGTTPVDVLQDEASSLLCGQSWNPLSPVTCALGGTLSTLLGSVQALSLSNDHGVVVGTDSSGQQVLQGLRFATVEPTALPPVPVDYDGPVTDYVGVGPKLVRLVR